MENKKIKRLILLVAFTALMLIATTYAWFTMNMEVEIGNLQGTVNIVEGLEISLDAANWSDTIDFSKYADQTALRKIYTTTEEHNIIPKEMIPVSTNGKEGIGKTDITMYRGVNEEGIKLKTVQATSTEVPDTDVKNNQYPGYYAIDLFVKNSSKPVEGKTEDVLQLNADSLVKIMTGGTDKTGLENTVRVALAKYTAVENGTTASVDVNATQSQIINATTGSAVIGDVAIWEPNSSNHETQIVLNNNRITWKAEDKAGYIADQTNGKFTATEKVPTYGLLAKAATDIKDSVMISDIYDWNETNSDYMGKQVTLQTTRTEDSYVVAEGVQNLISVNSAEASIYPIKPAESTETVTTFTIPRNKVTRLRMYIWLEGQDVDCTNLASHGGGISVNLSLTKDAEVGAGAGTGADLTSLSFENTEEYVDFGDTLNLQAKTNEGVSNPNLTWTAEDTTVLSIEVDSTDSTKVKITPLKEGETVVTVTSTEDDSITASVTVYALNNNVSVASLFSLRITQPLETSEGTYLPKGFSEVAGTSLATGLTIADSKGNQYVWVEVPQTEEVYGTELLNITDFAAEITVTDPSKTDGSTMTVDGYTAIEKYLHKYTNVYRNGTSYTDTWYSEAHTGLTSDKYTELKQKMLKSVYQNGGFYVGKYETGIEAAPKTSGSSSGTPTQTPVIKQNAYPYNYVTCKQAQSLASSMESGEYTSSLMFGVQWDLVLKYLETKGATQKELNDDSTDWGNYKNNNWTISNANSKYSADYGETWTNDLYNGTGSKGSTSKGILLSTGASEDFSKQGIYDIAGNVHEWTLEYTSHTGDPCTYRGGLYGNDGNGTPASYRDYYYRTFYDADIGFRSALY